MTKYRVVQTVTFDRPITGDQLAALVREAVSGETARFETAYSYNNGETFVCGQSSGYPCESVGVTPLMEDFVRPDEEYMSVTVHEATWNRGQYLVGYDDPMAVLIDTVTSFAERLQEAYATAVANGFPEYSKPEPVSPFGSKR